MMKRIDQLTFTRFIAVMVVLLFHGGGGIYGKVFSVFPFPDLFTSATSAVTYLYALSGFVMALAHYRPDEKISFEDYWKARFVRLYPLYIIAFLLVCYYYDITITTLKMRNTLVNVFVVQAWFSEYAQSYNFPAWSVTVEFFFYAVFPLFAWWASRQSAKKLIWVSLVLWAVTQSVHTALWIGFFPAWTNFLTYFPLFHLSSFILGVAGGIWYLREGCELKINPRVNLLFLAAGIFLTSVYVIISNRITSIPRGDQLMTGFLAPFLTLVIISLALDQSRLSTILKHPALIALGDMSYALFIFHIPIRWLYEKAWQSLPNYQIIFGYTYLPAMIAISFGATYYIDQPIRNWLKKIMRQVSMPLLLFDLAILSFSIFYSFRFRFDTVRTRDLHYPIYLLVFWSAFMLRPVCAVIFKTLSPSMLCAPFMQFFRAIFISATAGSLAVACVIYAGFRFGWIEGNFPRSILLIDWAIVLVLSVVIRYGFRLAGFYSPKTVT